MATIDYWPTKTGTEFHQRDDLVRLIVGPIGSGKSVASIVDVFIKCSQQKKQKDGIRRSRWAIVRNSYRELADTTLRTWLDWFPEGQFGHYIKSDNTYFLKYGDIEAEILFRALDTPDDVKKLLSLELTGAFFNEAKEIAKPIFNMMKGRIKRYPAVKDGGSNWCGIIMDTNPPDDDHWIYKLFEEERPEQHVIFHQPPAVIRDGDAYSLNPVAENIGHWEPFDDKKAAKERYDKLVEGGLNAKIDKKRVFVPHLADRYYEDLVIGQSHEWIKVYGMGKYGIVQDGKSVYPEYNDDLHCAEFDADPNLPLHLGWDGGLTPSCIIGQLSPRGQLRILHEITSEDMDVQQFARDIVKPLLAQHYRGYSYQYSTLDPASKKRSEGDGVTALGVLNDDYEGEEIRLPFMTFPASTNSLEPRFRAVRTYLIKLIDGKPGFLLHKRCKSLRKGFLGRYEFGRVQVTGEDRYKDVPKKNVYSHPHDALQYLCLSTIGENDEIEESYEQPRKVSGLSGY